VFEVGGGYQLLTRPEFAPVLERFDTVPAAHRLSGPALETLAIIAYRQPVGRAEVEEIRGVGAGGVLKTLAERGLSRWWGGARGWGGRCCTGRRASSSSTSASAPWTTCRARRSFRWCWRRENNPRSRMPQRSDFLKPGQPVRLQTFLSRSGIASRRGAEELISDGRVAVNGSTVTAMGVTVKPGVDRVAVDGEEVKVAPLTWIALHKPTGYVTSRDDPFDRRTVYELLPERYHGLFHVGRLDRDSEGILLLTNDGELAHRLLHPSFGVTKEYDVVAAGKPSDAALRQLVEGVELEDGVARAESAKLMGPAGNGLSRLKIVLREGKKREVRRMLEALGHPVRRLIRRRFGPITLAELPKGKFRVVAPEELANAFEARGSRPEPSRRADASAGGDAPPRRARAVRVDADDDAPPRRKAPARGAKPGPGRGRPSKERAGPARGGKPGAGVGPRDDARQEGARSGSAGERPSAAGRVRRGRSGRDLRAAASTGRTGPARGGKAGAGAGSRDDARQEGARRGPAAERPTRGASSTERTGPARGGKAGAGAGPRDDARQEGARRGAGERPARGGSWTRAGWTCWRAASARPSVDRADGSRAGWEGG
jgi:23S rRNA pseudouridine2605 synthase